jgi:hypothetical protein
MQGMGVIGIAIGIVGNRRILGDVTPCIRLKEMPALVSATRTARCYAIVHLDETAETKVLLDDNVCGTVSTNDETGFDKTYH